MCPHQRATLLACHQGWRFQPLMAAAIATTVA